MAEHVDVGRTGEIKRCEAGVIRAPLHRHDVDPVDSVAREQAPDSMCALVDECRIGVSQGHLAVEPLVQSAAWDPDRAVARVAELHGPQRAVGDAATDRRFRDAELHRDFGDAQVLEIAYTARQNAHIHIFASAGHKIPGHGSDREKPPATRERRAGISQRRSCSNSGP